MNRTSRIQSFDHESIAHLPEYQAASKALDALAHALITGGYAEIVPDWGELVATMAKVLPYSDMCNYCDRINGTHISAPVSGVVKDGWLSGRYWCERHDRWWTCGYAVWLPEYLP